MYPQDGLKLYVIENEHEFMILLLPPPKDWMTALPEDLVVTLMNLKSSWLSTSAQD